MIGITRTRFGRSRQLIRSHDSSCQEWVSHELVSHDIQESRSCDKHWSRCTCGWSHSSPSGTAGHHHSAHHHLEVCGMHTRPHQLRIRRQVLECYLLVYSSNSYNAHNYGSTYVASCMLYFALPGHFSCTKCQRAVVFSRVCDVNRSRN